MPSIIEHMLSHEELAFLLQKLYPGTENGKDYLTAHWVAHGSAEQTGPAQIVDWKREDLAQPSDKEIKALWKRHSKEYETIKAANHARARRNALLTDVDATINRLEDGGARAADWRAYRKALRDVPQQPGFPHKIAWPKEPKV
ncbi:XkdW family protein [Paraburkholderia nodosa]|uniref:XkdW family protein n=1 Tax=Paraburkholderia nodosa TaxID=392320 RepID=UPI0004B7F74E|nr:phage tail assembly chaperone [Paraburkholderia nodosa]